MSFLFITVLFLFQQTPSGYDAKLYEKAVKLSQSTIMLDGHIDAPTEIMEKGRAHDISVLTTGDFDYPKAKKGGLDAPFMSIYLDADFQKTPGASKKHAIEILNVMDSVISKNPNKFAHALNPDDIRENFKKGIMSLPYGMENGSGIEDDLSNVKYFYDRGIRYITLTHGKKNLICDSSYDPEKGLNGISPFGKKVIEEMNRLGIMVDISHVSDSAFYQALEFTKAPPICSHSSCRVFTPDFERSVSDDMLKKLAKKGGVIQINFGSAFLNEAANKYSEKRKAYVEKFKSENQISSSDDARVKDATKKFNLENPYPFATVSTVADHIDHVVGLVGIDFVGIGSDFDGVGDSLPIGLKTAQDMPNLVYELLKRGYSEKDIEKILSGNVLRVWQKVTDYAKMGSIKGL